jgi:hypothetical protein
MAPPGSSRPSPTYTGSDHRDIAPSDYPMFEFLLRPEGEVRHCTEIAQEEIVPQGFFTILTALSLSAASCLNSPLSITANLTPRDGAMRSWRVWMAQGPSLEAELSKRLLAAGLARFVAPKSDSIEAKLIQMLHAACAGQSAGRGGKHVLIACMPKIGFNIPDQRNR